MEQNDLEPYDLRGMRSFGVRGGGLDILAYSFCVMNDLLFDKVKGRLPAVSGKRPSVIVFNFNRTGKVQLQSGIGHTGFIS